jgi:hypothetical protein
MRGQHGRGRVLKRGLLDFKERFVALQGELPRQAVLAVGGRLYYWLCWLLIFLGVLLQIIS